MKIRYLYSACVSIETEDCTVLCDPWFGKAYDGSWVQWPMIDQPIETCGPTDYVYISHIHPDHYDPAFLQQYLARYPKARVLIAQQTPPLLEHKLLARGIDPIRGSILIGTTTLRTVPNLANVGMNIDSALRVSCGEHSVVNLNDNPYDQGQIDELLQHGPPTVALLPFVGAGPWPQCYAFDTPEEQQKAAEAKKQKYLDLFSRYCHALQPKIAVTFAGQYALYRENLDLNPLRGMADAVECRKLHERVWVPADGGQSVLDVGTLEWNTERTQAYDWPTMRADLMKMGDVLYRYEREIHVPIARLPLLKLLQTAAAKAQPWFRDRPEMWLAIKTQQHDGWLEVCTRGGGVKLVDRCEWTPRVEVTLDARYLFGMLTRLYNANSVRIGSLCQFKCVPNVYDKATDDLFGEFWDSLRV